MDSVSVFAPRLTPVVAEDEPVSETREAPEVVAEMSNTPAPLDVTPEEEAMDPDPLSASVPPATVVALV